MRLFGNLRIFLNFFPGGQVNIYVCISREIDPSVFNIFSNKCYNHWPTSGLVYVECRKKLEIMAASCKPLFSQMTLAAFFKGEGLFKVKLLLWITEMNSFRIFL